MKLDPKHEDSECDEETLESSLEYATKNAKGNSRKPDFMGIEEEMEDDEDMNEVFKDFGEDFKIREKAIPELE